MQLFRAMSLMVPALLLSQAHAQNYPVKAVRVITSEAGGGGDFTCRVLAQELSGMWGQQLLVDNRGIVGAETVARSAPDGHTLLLYGGNVWISPLMRQVSWDPVNDFAPITLPVSAPHVISVHPSLPVRSIGDLIVLARARPGQLNYAANTAGSSTHLTGELFKSIAGINMSVVHYRAIVQGLNDLIGGQLQVIVSAPGTVMTFAKSGRVRALAVTSEKPSALVPGLPPAGLPGFESGTTYGLFAPAKTPPAIIARIHQDVVKVITRPEISEKLLNGGVEVIASSPEQLAAKIRFEMARLGKVIRDNGIRAE